MLRAFIIHFLFELLLNESSYILFQLASILLQLKNSVNRGFVYYIMRFCLIYEWLSLY